jgi:hypothetical protein
MVKVKLRLKFALYISHYNYIHNDSIKTFHTGYICYIFYLIESFSDKILY